MAQSRSDPMHFTFHSFEITCRAKRDWLGVEHRKRVPIHGTAQICVWADLGETFTTCTSMLNGAFLTLSVCRDDDSCQSNYSSAGVTAISQFQNLDDAAR